MVGQPPLALSKQAQPRPTNHTAIVTEHFAFAGTALAPGSQLSEPATAPDSMFGPHAWYSCLRSPTRPAERPLPGAEPPPPWTESVLIYRNERIQGQIPGPAPHFCDGQTYHPIA